MRLLNVHKYFDKEQAYDAYSGEPIFKCRFSSFNDATSSGATARRRVLGIAPDIVLPPRKVVSLFDLNWIAGDSTMDGYFGSEIRQQVNMKKATGLFSILTPAEACLAAVGTTAYAAMAYFKDLPDTLTSSDQDVYWNIFFSNTETVVKANFLRFGSTIYRVRTNYITDDKYALAEADELDSACRKAVVFTSVGAYNVVTDVLTPASIATYGIVMEVPKFYKFQDEAQDRYASGDQCLFVAKSAVTPAVNSRFTMDGFTWGVLSVISEVDAWALHVRRAA